MGTNIIKRCDIFINIFEKYVQEQQEKINNLREMEFLYNIVSSVVNNWTIDNAVKVSLDSNTINISIIGKPTDNTIILKSLIQSINDILSEHKLRDFENIEIDELTTSYYWSVKKGKFKPKGIYFVYSVPEEGTNNLYWIIEYKTYQYENKKLRLRY